jgi:hypothetical protein
VMTGSFRYISDTAPRWLEIYCSSRPGIEISPLRMRGVCRLPSRKAPC